jgi:hypothetical protein
MDERGPTGAASRQDRGRACWMIEPCGSPNPWLLRDGSVMPLAHPRSRPAASAAGQDKVCDCFLQALAAPPPPAPAPAQRAGVLRPRSAMASARATSRAASRVGARRGDVIARCGECIAPRLKLSANRYLANTIIAELIRLQRILPRSRQHHEPCMNRAAPACSTWNRELMRGLFMRVTLECLA